MTRDDLRRFQALEIDFESIGLMQRQDSEPYFCTPVGAEFVGWLGCDGIHFILLPEDERVFCVDPAMGEPGTYVLPVAEDFRRFLSFMLFCRDANPISQIWWMGEERFRSLLEEDAAAENGSGYFRRKSHALEQISGAFALMPADPYGPVRELQAGFDPAVLAFSPDYYDVLGLEQP